MNNAEGYINLKMSDVEIELTVLTTVCRMLVNRKHMDIKKYARKPGKFLMTKVVSPSESDKIDNDLFLPLIENKSDTATYELPIDNHFTDLRDGEEATRFDGSKCVVRIMDRKLTDVNTDIALADFLKTYPHVHKIAIYNQITDKASYSLNNSHNVEVFDRDTMMLDLMGYMAAPEECDVVTDDDIKHIANPDVSLINEWETLARYFNASKQKGHILRIVQSNISNSVSIGYRRVV